MNENRSPRKMTRRQFLAGSAAAVVSLAAGCGRLRDQRTTEQAAAPSSQPAARPIAQGSGAGAGAGGAPDLIIRNGKVLTMDHNNTTAQAVAIKNGLIQAVGKEQDIGALSGAGTKVIDAGGRVVTPGMVDPHIHYRLIGLMNSYYTPLMPPDVSNIATMQKALKEVLKSKKPGEWVMAYYLVLQDNMYPDKSLLDAVSPNNPVFIFHIGGHWGTANSAALKLANITPAMLQKLEGGIIEMGADGQPTGLLYNHRAMDVVRRNAPPITQEMIGKSILDSQKMLAACGVTTIQDNNIRSPEDIKTYQQLSKEKKFFLRNFLFLTMEWPTDMKNADVVDRYSDDITHFAGWKFLIDGQTPTAFCHEPHNGVSWNISTWEANSFKQAVRTLHDTGLQICVHCAGDAAADLTLDAFAAAMKANPRPDPRHRIEHAVLTTSEATRRMKDLGVVVSTNPHFLFIGGDSYQNIFGPERAKRIMVTREWIDSGIHMTIGSDAPTTPFYTPQATMGGAISRLTFSKKPLNPEQIITIEEALKAHTYEAAYAIHQEKVIGSLEPGKFADVAIWAQDPTKQNLKDLVNNTTMFATLIGGKVVHQA